MSNFKHQALDEAQRPLETMVYTALSKHFFYMRLFVSKFVLEQDAVPLNPFTTFDYFMLDTVDRNIVRRGNNTLLQRADEVWTFGDISDGILAELLQAQKDGKPVKYFALDENKQFREIAAKSLVFEPEIAEQKSIYLANLGR
jgi:hypothetical protein